MIFETFAQRMRAQSRSGEPEVYIYDQAPKHMRHQICMAVSEGFGSFVPYANQESLTANYIWREIDRICLKELASYLEFIEERDLSKRFLGYLNRVQEIEDFLSAVEVACTGLSMVNDRADGTKRRGARLLGIEAIQEINIRFQQHGIGYQYENRRLIRVDSKLTHAEIIKPTLTLLATSMFTKPNDDFMTAHQHYRTGQFQDCVTASNRAFESIMKVICDTESWEYSKGDGASELVTRVTSKGLFTHAFDKSFTAYVAMLKTGLPTVRNDAGAHGQRLAAATVTAHIARLALNLTASNILFIGESYLAMKKPVP